MRVKKLTSYILLILFGLTLSLPAFARAHPHPSKRDAQRNARSVARKNAKQAKKDRKSSKKATQNWKKRRQSGF
jgi:hypothetical protein